MPLNRTHASVILYHVPVVQHAVIRHKERVAIGITSCSTDLLGPKGIVLNMGNGVTIEVIQCPQVGSKPAVITDFEHWVDHTLIRNGRNTATRIEFTKFRHRNICLGIERERRGVRATLDRADKSED